MEISISTNSTISLMSNVIQDNARASDEDEDEEDEDEDDDDATTAEDTGDGETTVGDDTSLGGGYSVNDEDESYDDVDNY